MECSHYASAFPDMTRQTKYSVFFVFKLVQKREFQTNLKFCLVTGSR